MKTILLVTRLFILCVMQFCYSCRLFYSVGARSLLTDSVLVLACVCAEYWRAISPFFDSSSTSSSGSSTTASACPSAEYQSSLSGCSRSCCFLFPLNLAARSCGVIGHICHASCRLAVPDRRIERKRGLGTARRLAIHLINHIVREIQM